MKQTFLSFTVALFAITGAGSSCAQTAGGNKQALVQKVLSLWHIEDVAISMAQRPASDALLKARVALQGRVSPEKQEATLKAIVADVQKYIDEATPIVRAGGLHLKEPTLGPLLQQSFSEEELRALIALFESPVKKKFESLVPKFERAFGEKVAEHSRAVVDPKLQSLSNNIGTKLRAAMLAP